MPGRAPGGRIVSDALAKGDFMKVGIMSDSHDNLPQIRKAVGLLAARGAKVLIHTGDIVAPFSAREVLNFPGLVYGVFGNNDGETAGLKKLWKHIFFGPYLFEIGGRRILACHDEADLERAPYDDIDVRIFGHSHAAEVRNRGTLDINPGETGGWLTGRSTCAILDTDTLEAEILELA